MEISEKVKTLLDVLTPQRVQVALQKMKNGAKKGVDLAGLAESLVARKAKKIKQ